MGIRYEYIESLFCAIISELGQNKTISNKLYTNFCDVIIREGFHIPFSQINFDSDIHYEKFINRYNDCYENLSQKQSNQLNEDHNEFEEKFEIIKKIASGGYGEVYEVKSLVDDHYYAVKKTYIKGINKYFYLNNYYIRFSCYIISYK
jgi:hypothetical protein